MGTRVPPPGSPHALHGTVLVTGGTGSLGQALVGRAVTEGWDARLIVYSRDEVKQASMRERFPTVRYLLGDVQDADTLGRAMRGVDAVIHAAAYKRVPEAERETIACVQANVTGSMNVAREAVRAGVALVIGLSTDKACAPINAYGQSKALMERIWQSDIGIGPTRFVLTRYGNVLASRGSVVPILRAQAEHGGPLLITDPAMTRFWLTLDDAVDLILAAQHLEPGRILVPACRSADMATLADALAPGMPTLSIGVRAGEKPHEQLVNIHEVPHTTAHPMGWVLHPLDGQDGDHSLVAPVASDTVPRFSTAVLASLLAGLDSARTLVAA